MGLVMNKPVGEVADLALELARESLSTLDEKENKA